MSRTSTTPPAELGHGRVSPLERLAGWAQRHHWWALAGWLAVLVSVSLTSGAIGTDYRNDVSLPGTQSQEVADIFEASQAGRSTDTVQIVVHAEDGVAAHQAAIQAMIGDVETLDHVAEVAPPEPDAGSVSDDGATGFATVVLDSPSSEVPGDDVRRIVGTAQDHGGDGLQVEVGGDAVRGALEGGGGAEGAGMLAALVILLFMFGSLLAALLPLVTAVFAVGSTIALIGLASHVFTVPDYAAPVMILVGLGVGIDYALLIFSRYRSELLHGADRDRATRIALDTAGRSVLFAGATVIIALGGLLALGLGSLQGVALGVTITVLTTMLAAVTLLPALLHLFGPRIEARVRRRAARTGGRHGDHWRRLADVVMARPWPPLVAGVLVLLALTLPALDIRLGFADAGNDPESKTTRAAYDLVAEGFGPGFNGPLIVLTEGSPSAAREASRDLAGVSGVARALPPQALDTTDTWLTLVIPRSAPQDEETGDLVSRLRDDVLPRLEQQHHARYLVGGPTAAVEDFATTIADRLPLFIGMVVGLSAVLLLVVFHSVLIPVKAAVLNLLSIGACLGVMKLVFQDGRFGAVEGPIEAYVPVMIFAIVFGLSMDYEVFLLSRTHEEWRRFADARRAVREGLAATGGVITAAAAIMIVVFGAFVLSPDRMLQQFGLGLAVAVFLDALVIRCLIVPAVMRLLGTAAWWTPRGLARWLPRTRLERD